jgi:phosphoglycerol transferase
MKYRLRNFASEISYWGSGLLLSIMVPYVTYWGNSSTSPKEPLLYAGDELFGLWGIRRIIEGGINDNSRMGYPFGSNFLDYPDSDGFHELIIRFLGFFISNLPLILNLFYLLGFVACFVSSFIVLRELEISPLLSWLGSLLFAFLPYHFDRIGHLYLTWYFTIPIFILLSFKVYSGNVLFKNISLKNKLLLLVLGLVLGSSGIYYSFFGLLVVLFGAIVSVLRNRKLENSKIFFFYIATILLGTFLNLLPSILHRMTEGTNTELGQRSMTESEVYGFKLIQLFLPRQNHHVGILNDFSDTYARVMPFVNENRSSSLGLIGSFGLILVILKFCRARQNQANNREQVGFLFGLTIFLATVGITGGLGSLFAITVSPQIRAWNRVIVFIGFLAIYFFVKWLESALKLQHGQTGARPWKFALLVTIAIIGVYDQTPVVDKAFQQYASSTYKQNYLFVEKIEQAVGSEAAIYQIPYVPFPESPPIFQMDPYFQLEVGTLSSSLKSNVGNLKGSEADLFFRALSLQELDKQIQIASQMGFSGVYLDMRAFEDRGAVLESQLRANIQIQNYFRREDGNVLFLVIQKTAALLTPLPKTVSEVRRALDFYDDESGPRYDSTFENGIDFSKDGFPRFLYKASGLADNEAWGTWADSNKGKKVELSFVKKLPPEFRLIFSIQPFTPMIGQKVEVEICGRKFSVKTTEGFSEYALNIDQVGDDCSKITFTPAKSSSPADLNQSADQRQLSIGFQYLRILPTSSGQP